MRKLLYILVAFVMCVMTSCNSDEPQDNGFLVVNLIQEDAAEEVDFSDYKIMIMPEQSGFGWETLFKEISWPVSRPSGEYIVIAESPVVSETATSRSCYTAMERNILIIKDKTTEITLTLKLEEFPKD